MVCVHVGSSVNTHIIRTCVFYNNNTYNPPVLPHSMSMEEAWSSFCKMKKWSCRGQSELNLLRRLLLECSIFMNMVFSTET